jgi:hypothetical protein
MIDGFFQGGQRRCLNHGQHRFMLLELAVSGQDVTDASNRTEEQGRQQDGARGLHHVRDEQ